MFGSPEDEAGPLALGCSSLTNAQAVCGNDQRSNLYFVLERSHGDISGGGGCCGGLEWKRYGT
jgi:hypothetical protein